MSRLVACAACAAAVVVLATLVPACPTPQEPVTKCEGPDVGDGVPVERLPFNTEGLDPSCNLDAPDNTAQASAQIAGSANDLLNIFGCDQGTVDVDFTHSEVLVVDTNDTITIDGLFDNGGLILATSTSDACRGVPPQAQRQITVLQRIGDDGVGVRRCNTTDPNPPEFVCP